MPENTYSLEKTVMALWEKKRISSLRDLLLTLQPVQVAGLFEVLPEEARPLLSACCPRRRRRRFSSNWTPNCRPRSSAG